MDYTYGGQNICIEKTEYVRQQSICRMLLYYTKLLNRRFGKEITSEYKAESDKDVERAKFWDKESGLEQKAYMHMKKWETRHPIMGIAICTILGGILISLIAGIILEVAIKLM